MLYLQTNTANQVVRLTLDEARQYYATTFTNYLLVITHEENSSVGIDLRQVCVVISETQRITTLNITTVGLTLNGRYRYEVYGQNSATNTDPANASVVGLCEEGLLELSDGVSYFDVPNVSIQDDIIYNG
jgi:magnesium-transporting ATPase (P-type)